MSIYTAPFRQPSYILLNQKEHDLINANKQQGCKTLSYGYCKVCQKPLNFRYKELCSPCRNHLIRGTLFTQYTGDLRVIGDEWKKFYPLVTEHLVNQIDLIMNGKFKTKRYKAKTAKLLYIMDKYIKANGDIYSDVCYRRLRYYADSSSRDNLQLTLKIGKKIFEKII
ncbi:hypothetical protein [Poseidonibacter ostreae]|uniref:Uncharacterized protein n=1 Tax=Poseidonibacter ostreae TaxID=2654171 RepID=A0A6L4WSE3_9BACT|nr:hypothetical protein [Poseidonibacter ostreae]KAB7887139.1 hypothetical protein GA417_03685 [Poseidonibacter ostreae]KAB7888645.1 hypothetical protein GBG19_08525 [Poseidonibacter ostreae]KAB7892308.1 hypothetical protein GBG18_03395 [Poseidonibacter ostreae]